MNNEPVAWIRQSKYGKPIIVQNPLHQFSYEAECAKWDDIPLYTHPAKTLTDTDLTLILEVLIDSYDDTNRGFLEYEAIWKNSATRKAKIDGMKRMVDKHTHAIEMVEAILRKAQEK